MEVPENCQARRCVTVLEFLKGSPKRPLLFEVMNVRLQLARAVGHLLRKAVGVAQKRLHVVQATGLEWVGLRKDAKTKKLQGWYFL